MPELPEVETIVRSLRPQLTSATIQSPELLRKSSLVPKSLPLSALKDFQITEIQRRGKLILFTCQKAQNVLFLAIHLRMTGALLIQDVTTSDAYTRAIFPLTKNDSSFALIFHDIRAFGTLLVATEAMLSAWPYWKTLGPEPLDLDFATFNAMLDRKAFCQIKAILLDQHNLAGIGNIYADESLFAARIHPTCQARNIHEESRKELLQAIQSILHTAIDQCGCSIRNYRDANGNAGAFQNTLAVFGKSGTPCPRCGKILQKSTVAGRGTTTCPRCQKKP